MTKTEQRMEELLNECETLARELPAKEFMEQFFHKSTEVKFLHLKELYRIGYSPEESKAELKAIDAVRETELSPLFSIIDEHACKRFDKWLAE